MHSKNFALLLAVLLASAGCDKPKEESAPAPEVSLTLRSEAVGAGAGMVWAEVNTDADAQWSISLRYNGEESGWASVTPDTGVGTNPFLQISCKANTTYDSRSVDVTLVSKGITVTERLTQIAAATPPPAGGAPDNVANPSPPQASLTGWIELPSTDLSRTTVNVANTEFVSHSVIIGGVLRRNYSILYDRKEKISYWVAYPMCGLYIGLVDRSDIWGYNPLIPGSDQPYLYNAVSGYDRGHQIASSDRTSALEANMQTFYFTNITLQNSDLNQKAWASLEGMVRNNFSRCDTLYVVTGAVLRTREGGETVRYIRDKNGGDIAVPNYYFKILLQRKGNSYPAGIGFWFRNEPASNAEESRVYSKYATSIRNIENKTGFDFFANLPQATQDAFETSYSTDNWTGIVQQ